MKYRRLWKILNSESSEPAKSNCGPDLVDSPGWVEKQDQMFRMQVGIRVSVVQAPEASLQTSGV
jgi:hypothetical protein